MNGMSNSNNNNTDDVVECPLCMEPLDYDDLNFFPCTCGYQICRFCWHRIRTDENKLCPACRKEYPENPADFTPLTQEQMIKYKSQKRQRDQQRKQKITENRKHLANVRVVQKNLVFVVGLPPRLADADILKKHEYFGKFGKIHKVVINPSTAYAGVQGPSASAYVTYVNNSDALRAIQSVNNITIDGRLIKTSLGTTKYCSHFMKNQQCPKGDCMYLHELGDTEASFTKEEMHQGKHQEYEKRLHEALIATSGAGSNSSNGGIGGHISSTGGGATAVSITTSITNGSSSSAGSSAAPSPGTTHGSTTTHSTAPPNGQQQQKDAWPSLSVSPVGGIKDATATINGNGGNKNKKDKPNKHDKSKVEKNVKAKSKNGNSSTNKEQSQSKEHSADALGIEQNGGSSHNAVTNNKTKSEKSKDRNNDNKTTIRSVRGEQQQQKEKRSIIADDEVKQIEDADQLESGNDTSKNTNNNTNSNNNQSNERTMKRADEQQQQQRSLSSSSISSNSSSSRYSKSNSELSHTSTISESTSGKSSPGSFPDCATATTAVKTTTTPSAINGITTRVNKVIGDGNGEDIIRNGDDDVEDDHGDDNNADEDSSCKNNNNSLSSNDDDNDVDAKACSIVMTSSATTGALISEKLSNDIPLITTSTNLGILDTTAAALSKLNFFDDNNSFFSSSTASATLQQSMLLKNKHLTDLRHNNQMNNSNSNLITSQLPDLLNGIDGYQSNQPTTTSEWEETLKLVRNSKQMEEHIHQHQQHPFHHHHHHHQLHQQQQQQQEEYLRMQEMQKRKSFLNNISLSQLNGTLNDFSNLGNSFHNASDLNRLSQAALMQQQQQLLQQQQNMQNAEHVLNSTLFGTNMSKFFDFHKNQQQQQQQMHQILVNNHNNGGNTLAGGIGASGGNQVSDHLRMASMIENTRLNPTQFMDQGSGLQQQQLQKQRLLGGNSQQQGNATASTQQSNAQQQNARLVNQFAGSVDDDLGFDPFIETQKALAELMENEVVQQQNLGAAAGSNPTNVATKLLQQQQQQQHQQQQQQQHQLMDNMQRARMPPPGFNHMSAFGFGVPRAQSTSKILPFMNMPPPPTGSATAVNGQLTTQQQQQLSMANSWNPHMGMFQQQQQPQLGEQQGSQNQKGYSNNDWTAMDPAILSFRQFSSFPQQSQQMPHQQQQQQDLFMQHLTQQQQQQPNQNFSAQAQQQQQLHGGVNLPNTLLNAQTSQAQANFNHSNWLNSEQTLFMNSLANGFGGNAGNANANHNMNFEKFPIPPPGIHPSNLSKQQKAECIN